MSYPCNECGIAQEWSIFSEDKEVVGYEACEIFPHNSYIDGKHVIQYQPLGRKNYEVIVRIWRNGSGENEYVEKLK